LIKAVIFDFDGLIVDTETTWFEAYKEVMKIYGVDLPLARFAKCVGSDDGPLYEFVRQQLGENVDIEEIEAKAANFYQIKMKTPKAREGVKDYLEEAKQLGCQTAIASSSSKEWVIYYLTKLGLLSYFDVIVTKEDVEKIKPAPDLYQKVLATLNVHPNESVVFEDSLNGLLAALAAGVKCVIVPNPVTQFLPFEKCNLRLNSMAEKRLADVIELIEGT